MSKRGRPTSYNEEQLIKAEWYVENHDQEGDVVPTTAGLALFLGVVRSTLHEWKKQHEDFSNMLDNLQAKQEKLLVANGLQNKFSAVITKLMLAKHDYTDKIDHTSKGERLPTPILSSVPDEQEIKRMENEE